jgi:hypothetical protein
MKRTHLRSKNPQINAITPLMAGRFLNKLNFIVALEEDLDEQNLMLPNGHRSYDKHTFIAYEMHYKIVKMLTQVFGYFKRKLH